MEKPRSSRPKRVSRGVAQQYALVPLPVGAEAGEMRKCVGHLVGRGVCIRDPIDMRWIFSSGFYGKGSLSKSAPVFWSAAAAAAQPLPAPAPPAAPHSHQGSDPRPQQHQFAPLSSREFPQLKRKEEDLGDDGPEAKRARVGNEDPDFQATLQQVMGTEDPPLDQDQNQTTDGPRSVLPEVEHLQLCLEEALFLSFGLGCLEIVVEEEGVIKSVTSQQFWERCKLLKKDFVAHYAAYHHFRAKGWVTKSGIKYGVDWILYRRGPVFFHSE